MFAANGSLVHATLMLAFLVAGPVVGLVGAKATYLLGGAGALAAALLAGSALRTLRPEWAAA